MPEIVIIDGNNLLHAVRVLGPTRPPGRERLTRLIEGWATEHGNEVTLVFDGARPQGAFGRQMQPDRIELVFSGSRTADDCIVERLSTLPNADRVLVVSDDTAIQYEVRRRRGRCVSTTAFIASLFPPDHIVNPPTRSDPVVDKPVDISEQEQKDWLALFDDGPDDEPFDGFNAMHH